MDVNITRLGSREFLQIGDYATVPIDRIRSFNFRVSNGGATGNSVQIVTDDENEEHIFAFENCQAVSDFITAHRIGIDEMEGFGSWQVQRVTTNAK